MGLTDYKLHLIVGLNNIYLVKETDVDKFKIHFIRYRNTGLHRPESSMIADLHNSK